MTDDERPASTPEELERLAGVVDSWAKRQIDHDWVAAVERDGDAPRWFVRVNGEEKSVFSVWFFLRQRSLFVETYVLPAPEENEAAVYEFLLRRNLRIFGMSFAIGGEDAICLKGEIHNSDVCDEELDRLLGTAYMMTEECFRPAMRLAFASKFQG
ncbi:MAG: YbjN domain-containing protein [Acidimicrobiales bacterium]